MASANLFGRQGSPFPLVRQVSLGADGTASVLVAPAVVAFRLDNLASLDARISKKLDVTRATVSLDADVFNVLNANTMLGRRPTARRRTSR